MWLRNLLIVVLLLGVWAPGARAEEILRPPVAAGAFYPDNADELLRTVRGLFDQVSSAPRQGRLVALVVPHSGYEYAGRVMAQAFKHLEPGQYRRVIILAPSHFQKFDGCSIPHASGFVTPLGVVPLDGEAINKLIFSPLISTRALRYERNDGSHMLHEREHDIEVLLPFLQERLGLFHLVPILVGNLLDTQGRFTEGAVEAVTDAIEQIMDEETLLIVSTDFTHYGSDFSYRPFRENVLEQIQRLDETAMRLIVKRDFLGFQNFLEQTQSTICGATALHLMLKLLPPRTTGRVLDYDLSARHTNNLSRSVSYAAISFHDTTQPRRPARPAHNPFAIPQAQVPGHRPAAREAAPAPAADPAPETEREP